MKKILYMILFLLLFLPSVKAASGPVYVYHNGQNKAVKNIKQHMGSIGYSVEGRKNWDGSGLVYALQDGKIIVYFNHGAPGLQSTKCKYQDGWIPVSGISSTKAYTQLSYNNTGIRYLGSEPNGSFKQLKLVIMFGCKTGQVTSYSGDLPAMLVKKGAQTAIAWKEDVNVSNAVEWSRLFFEKAKEDSIVMAMRHADYWLERIKGSSAAAAFRKNRNEKGNIDGYVY